MIETPIVPHSWIFDNSFRSKFPKEKILKMFPDPIQNGILKSIYMLIKESVLYVISVSIWLSKERGSLIPNMTTKGTCIQQVIHSFVYFVFHKMKSPGPSKSRKINWPHINIFPCTVNQRKKATLRQRLEN